MSSNLGVSSPFFPTHRSSFDFALANRRKPLPDIKCVLPVVRWAILVKHTPHLTTAHTEKVLAEISHVWETWSDRYLAEVAEQAGISKNSLRFVASELVRLKIDGKTPMLDLPRVQTDARESTVFDLRNCAALCTDEYSSKIWSRIGLPAERHERGVAAGDLRSVAHRYRKLARAVGEWFFEQFYGIIRGALEGIEHERVGILEITTVGLQVEGDQDDEEFHAWLLDGAGGPNFSNDELCQFLADAANLDFHPKHLREKEPESFWMSIPSAVRLANGDLVSRQVLYLVRPVNDSVQVVGVGLDDSQAGELASHVALKISRLVANRV